MAQPIPARRQAPGRSNVLASNFGKACFASLLRLLLTRLKTRLVRPLTLTKVLRVALGLGPGLHLARDESRHED